MTGHADPDELAMTAEGLLRRRMAARIGSRPDRYACPARVHHARDDQQRSVARSAHSARLTLPAGPGEGRKRRIDKNASPSAIFCLSSASPRNAPAQEESPSDAELLRRHVSGDTHAFG